MKTCKLSATISNREGSYSYDYAMNIDLPDDAHGAMEGLLNKGFGEVLRDKFSTYKIAAVGKEGEKDYKPERTATPEEKHAHTEATRVKLEAGTYVFGGFGARLSPEDKAMKAALKDAGFTVKKGQEISTRLEDCTKALALSQEKEFDPAMVEKVEKALKASEIYKTTLKAAQPKKSTDLDKIEL